MEARKRSKIKGSKEAETGAHIAPYPCAQNIPSDPARAKGHYQGRWSFFNSPFVLSSHNFVILLLSCKWSICVNNEILNWK